MTLHNAEQSSWLYVSNFDFHISSRLASISFARQGSEVLTHARQTTSSP